MSNIIPFKTPIVHTEGNRVFATSRDVAEFFEKEHRHVLRDIDLLVAQGVPNFGQGYYTLPATGSQQHRFFDMDRDGFSLLAMGFTGPKALKFKLAYIKAFNEAIERLKELEASGPVVALPDFTNPAEAARARALQWGRANEA